MTPNITLERRDRLGNLLWLDLPAEEWDNTPDRYAVLHFLGQIAKRHLGRVSNADAEAEIVCECSVFLNTLIASGYVRRTDGRWGIR